MKNFIQIPGIKDHPDKSEPKLLNKDFIIGFFKINADVDVNCSGKPITFPYSIRIVMDSRPEEWHIHIGYKTKQERDMVFSWLSTQLCSVKIQHTEEA